MTLVALKSDNIHQETGQYYLRARYYNPVIGRFTQEDSYRGDGLNLYAYCGNNPVMYYDPSGHTKVTQPTTEPEVPRTAGGGTNTSWYKPDGSINYPPNNGAVPGTEINITLKPGDTLGRYGNVGEKSNFVTQTGADASKLALPPNTDPAIYQEFIVIKDIPGAIQAEIAPWGDSVGGGLQYELPMPILQLIKEGYIEPR